MKYTGYDDNELFSVINPVCSGYHAEIVQLGSSIVKSTLQVRLVLFKKDGIGVDDCAKISKAVLPRIEVWTDNRDVTLEISSPGIGRILRNAYEFCVFKGEKISILVNNNWINGCILDANDSSVRITEENEAENEYNFDSIQKAKLI
ncbi:MAG: hypothetical protein PQJ46_02615 [Spirochaetales bacterium]|nr:hypothetical protein [Spirochaetales bacterium]